MRKPLSAAAIFTAVAFAAVGGPAAAQYSDGRAQPAQATPDEKPVATPQPYKAVTVKLPGASADASYAAFRKQLADVAKRKDRDALQKLMAAKGFFWQSGDGDHADKAKSAIDNLAKAIDLDAPEGHGWGWLAAAADDPTLEAIPEMKGVSCAPAGPLFDERAFDALVQSTGTDEGEWVVVAANAEIRSADDARAPVIETVGPMLIRILAADRPQSGAAPPTGDVPFVRVAAPSGKIGYLSADALLPLDFEQICYVRDGASWRIAGFFGGPP